MTPPLDTGTDRRPATFDEAERWFGWPRESVCDMPWPAACKNCDLVTEDPDAYFYPPDSDAEVLPWEGVCDGTGDVHEPMTWADFLERAKRWTAYVMQNESGGPHRRPPLPPIR